MDRQISSQEKNRARAKSVLRVGCGALAVAAGVFAIATFMTRSVNASSITLAEAEKGVFESSISAIGKVVPAYEEVITSPIASRILEVYRRPGDSLVTGTPLLLLDLQATEAEVTRLRESRIKQEHLIEQTRLNNASRLSELDMQIRVKRMTVSRLRADADNERRLDSIGSGTGDRVRQAELAYRTAEMELEQLQNRLENERQVLASSLESQLLDLNNANRNLAVQERILQDAQLRSPRNAILTFINTNIGARVGQGEKLATIADLSSFKIDAETSEGSSRYLAAGGDARIKVNGKNYSGTIMNVSPTSLGGAATFSVIPDSAAASVLRPGVSVNVYVIRDLRPDALFIPLGPYYTDGPGNYELYVATEPDVIERRSVQLGEANSDRVEVLSGLNPGDRVMVQGPDLSSAKYNLK